MTKAEFVTDVAAALREKHTATERTLNCVFATLEVELEGGKEVSWPGFGTFKVVDRAAREGRNPNTGEKIQIPAKKAVKFVAAKGLRDAIKG